jgi:hypothetical protein
MSDKTDEQLQAELETALAITLTDMSALSKQADALWAQLEEVKARRRGDLPHRDPDADRPRPGVRFQSPPPEPEPGDFRPRPSGPPAGWSSPGDEATEDQSST